MRKIIAVIICITMLFTFGTGCTPKEQPAEQPQEEPENVREEEYRFTFDPKAVSGYWREIFGDTMVQTWCNLVDAAMAGEETFECPDQYTYDWVIGQFPEKCFPVLGELIENYYDPVENGIAHLHYKTSREEFEEKVAKFTAQVEDILNATMKEDYTDLEKALSLYSYFCTTYDYDYDTYYKMEDEYQDYIRCYRLFEEGTGICQEISTAYSFLLTQAGVDATIMMGGDHAWSYVRINGKNYHVDPTFGLGEQVSLDYFMMTDDQREATYWECSRDTNTLASVYTQEKDCGTYAADDETFSPLWDSWLEDFDHAKHIIHYSRYDDNGDLQIQEFSYEGF